MPAHKNQHYVPGFYLKRFSPDDEKKTIGIWNLGSERRITGASLKDQCSRDYFYGQDLLLEKSFSNLEGLAAKMLREIDRTNALPPRCSENHALLLIHLVTQWTRTKYMAVRIPLNVATWSISKLPLVPSQSCRLIQAKLPPRRSVAARFGYYDWAFSDLPPFALTFRMDSPFSAMR